MPSHPILTHVIASHINIPTSANGNVKQSIDPIPVINIEVINIRGTGDFTAFGNGGDLSIEDRLFGIGDHNIVINTIDTIDVAENEAKVAERPDDCSTLGQHRSQGGTAISTSNIQYMIQSKRIGVMPIE